MDAVAGARLTSDAAWETIYPETEEAFRLREDDRSSFWGWRGEFWGKYVLSAIAASRYYRSDELKGPISRAVRGLLATQDKDGYIGTYADSTAFGPGTFNIWCRKYTLWGLLEAWMFLGDDSVLEGAVRFADHLLTQVGPGRHDIIQTGTSAGLTSTSILKPVVMLYRASRDAKYLEFAHYIVEQWSLNPEGPPDILNKGLSGDPIHTWFVEPQQWAKAYEFISCVEGLVELYEVTGDSTYLTAAKRIHSAIIAWERSPVGSVSFNDKFVGSRFLINTVAELCDAVYWNRLSFQLFCLTKDPCYLDEIERTLYNALLCGMNPAGSWGLRRLRASHEHIPAHSHFLRHHHCCVDNLPRGLFQAAEAVTVVANGEVYLGLYSPGRGTVRLSSGKDVGLAITGDMLDDGRVTVKLVLGEPTPFTLNLRMPIWSARTDVQVNAEEVSLNTPGTWLALRRTWRSGDRIDLTFDMRSRVEYFDPNGVSAADPIVDWEAREWASMGLVVSTYPEFRQRSALTVEDALPHQRAGMFFRGPVALAQDARLADSTVLTPIGVTDLDSVGMMAPLPPPGGLWKVFGVELGQRAMLRLCDFASAGNTWDERSRFAAWQLIGQ